MRTTYATALAAGVVAAGVALAACGGPDTPNSGTSTASTPTTTSPPPASMSGTASRGPTGTFSVSKQRAGEIATGKYGGQVLNVESDHAKGRPAWEVEIKNSDKGRIEVDVAKDNGDILEMETDNG